MKLYSYWIREKFTVQTKDGPKEISCLGRSDQSPEEALLDARRRREAVQNKISGASPQPADYDADIAEELIERLNDKNAVTRNRYGALILNTESTTIIDIDRHRRTFAEFLGLRKTPENKAAIMADMELLAARPEYADFGFRIYETCKGMRVILNGHYLKPAGKESRTLMRRCNADPLFALLCRKQDCYRARLTPKPERIGFKRIPGRWPFEPQDDAAIKRWTALYTLESEGYAVCHHLRDIGAPQKPNMVIEYHDKITKARSRLPLA
jgi:hypothetical protein